MMDNILEKLYTFAEVPDRVKSVNREERSLVAWASTKVIDRDGEVIDPKGWQLENYRKNPVVLLGHEYDASRALPVASSLWEKKKAEGLLFSPRFATTDIASDVFTLFAEGILRSFSVGFKALDVEDFPDNDGIKKPRRIYRSTELLEISVVNVPANPDALRLSLEKGAIKSKTVKEYMEKLLDDKPKDDAISQTDDAHWTDKADNDTISKLTEKVSAVEARLNEIAEKITAGEKVTQEDVIKELTEIEGGDISAEKMMEIISTFNKKSATLDDLAKSMILGRVQ